MNRGAVNRVTQLGVETTAGTSVAATTFTPTLSWMLKRDRETKKFRAQGSKVDSAHVLHKVMSKGSVEGILDYNSCIYLFNSLFNYATPAQIGALTAYTRVWTPGISTADSTGKTYTIEDGDSTACEDYAYTKVTSFDMTAGQDDFSVKGNLIARYPADGQTLASSPTEISQRPVERNDINLYIDVSYAALGTTQVTEALDESITIPDKYKEFFVHNSTAGEFYDIVETPYAPTFKFSTVHNSQSRTLIAAISTNPYRWIRWQAIGASLGTSGTERFETIQFDICVKFDTPEVISGDDGPLGYTYNCSMLPDTAGLTSFMKITSINSLSAVVAL